MTNADDARMVADQLGLRLDDADKRKIYFGNAMRLLKFKLPDQEGKP